MKEHKTDSPSESSDALSIFNVLAPLPNWVPWYPKPSARPGKIDKIPAVKARRLSNTNPEDWMDLSSAFAQANLLTDGGVGLVLTNGIELDGYRLVGIDIDEADADFIRPFDTYTEWSPSGKGLRQFAWAHPSCLEGYADTADAKLPHCDHVELYFDGTARFLTVTFDTCDEPPKPIAVLDSRAVERLLRLLKPATPPKPLPPPLKGAGTPIDLSLQPWLTTKHRLLLAGATQPEIDRSAVLASLLMTMSSHSVTQEDALATVAHQPMLWAICTDHRPAHPEDFAEREVGRAYAGKDGVERLREVSKAQVGKLGAAASGNESKSVFISIEDSRAVNIVDPFDGDPPFIVANALPVDNGVMAGPGGAGKSTVCLWEAVHIILGRDVWGNKVERPGPVLFLTAEDGAARLKRRLNKIMDGLRLNTAERTMVEKNLFVQDLVGKNFRLAVVESGGTVRINEEGIDSLVRLYAPEGLSVVNIDPLSHFSAGERFVNDNESSVNAGAARISRGLDCFVRLVSHVSKAVVRDGVDDQYVGRGGAALADNSRQMMQIRVEDGAPAGLPKEAEPLVALGAQVLGVFFHKVTDAKPWGHPLYLVRYNGWCFKELAPEEVVTASFEDQNKRDIEKIATFVVAKGLEGVWMSVRDVERRCGEVGVKKGMIETLVNEAVDKGLLIYKEVKSAGAGRPKLVLEAHTKTDM